MKNLTKRVLRLAKSYQDQTEIEIIRSAYDQVLDIFIEANYPNGHRSDSLMCSIHDQFPHGHNCVACNLHVQNGLLEEYLHGFKSFVNSHLVSSTFIILLYLLVERYQTYFKIIQLPDSYRLRYFSVFQKIVQWANFLKHPKSFMLSHHAYYYIENHIMPSDGLDPKETIVIDQSFVKDYYSGDKNNDKLHKLIKKKESVRVIFPDPVQLITDFVVAQRKFVEVIGQNEIVRDILNNEATITEYFEKESSEEELT